LKNRKHIPPTKNIVHFSDSVNNEDDINNKHSDKLKTWSAEMPNAPYSNRYQQGEKNETK
jgi:hypothetical protein